LEVYELIKKLAYLVPSPWFREMEFVSNGL